jgi:hypothetical protein
MHGTYSQRLVGGLRRRGKTITVFTALALAALCASASFQKGFSSRSPANRALTSGGQELWLAAPRIIKPVTRPIFALNSAEAVMLDRFVQEPLQGPLNVSYCCHLLRLYGLKAFRHPSFLTGSQVVGTLTDWQQCNRLLGQDVLLRTRSGIRYAQADGIFRNAENHRDLCLSTFAELGLPIDTPLKLERGVFSLRQLLRDSIANFDLKQKELAWSAIAYALYLRPQISWTNKYDENFTFDQLAEQLMQTSLREASCAGVHVAYAMTVLQQADLQEGAGLLSEPIREALVRRLAQLASAAVQSQTPEGYWTASWYGVLGGKLPQLGIPGEDSDSERLLMTGHVAEWLELLPLELQPPASLYPHATDWLLAELAKPHSHTWSSFCPRAHALCAIKALVASN